MTVILQKIWLEGSRGKREEIALFDSGATYSCIRPDVVKDLEISLPLPSPLEFTTAREGEKVVAKERVVLNFYLDGYRFSDEFMIIENLSEPVLIGAATLQKWRLKLDFEHDRVITLPEVTKLRLL